jgi:hypothetical protein
MTTRATTRVLGALMLFVLGTTSARATPSPTLTVLRESAAPDFADQTVKFHIAFNRSPDFQDADSHGRQADYFQFLLYAYDPARTPPGTVGFVDRPLAIIDGNAIYQYGAIPIRSIDPVPGGYFPGPVIDLVPYTLVGGDLTFTETATVLGTNNGEFDWAFQAGQYGRSSADGFFFAPEPPSSALAAIALGTGLVGLWRRRVVRYHAA